MRWNRRICWQRLNSMLLSGSLMTDALHLHRRFHHHRIWSTARWRVLPEFHPGCPEIQLGFEVVLCFPRPFLVPRSLRTDDASKLWLASSFRDAEWLRPEHYLAIVLTTPLKIQVALTASITLKMIETVNASPVKWKFPRSFLTVSLFILFVS